MWSELWTENAGDWASADTEITIGIANDDSLELVTSDSWSIADYVADGGVLGDYESDDPLYSDTLYVTWEFEAGSYGAVGVWINSGIEAYTADEEWDGIAETPAPGALLLAGLGAGLAGYLRRRSAI